jgi:excisionase family DNA binding protein
VRAGQVLAGRVALAERLPATNGERMTYSHLLTVRQVAELLNCSQSHIRRQYEAGKFPAPVRIGALVRWIPSTITSWLAAQEQGRAEAPEPLTPFRAALRRTAGVLG